MKKAIILFLALFMLSFDLAAFAEIEPISKENNTQNDIENLSNDLDINQKIKKEIKEAIIEVYGKKDSDIIYENVLKSAEKAISSRPEEFKKGRFKKTFRLV